MIGYWIVVAMVACAVAAVIYVTARNDAQPAPSLRRRGISRRPVWVALGASDATGEGTPDASRDNWIAQLIATLSADVEVHNLGVGGATLGEARRDQLPRALSLQPDILTCWLVVNDVAAGVQLADYEKDLDALLADLAPAKVQVIIGNLPDLSRLPAFATDETSTMRLRQSVEHWNATLARVAAAHQAVVVDLHDGPISPADFCPDGFHPSRLGHARLAARFRPSVEAALARVSAEPSGTMNDVAAGSLHPLFSKTAPNNPAGDSRRAQ